MKPRYFVAASRLEQGLRAERVGAIKRRRIQNRAAVVRFGGEVDDDVGLVMREQRGDGVGIGDVAADENIARIGFDVAQVFGVAGVSQQIEIHHPTIGVQAQAAANEIRADKAAAAGDQKNRHLKILKKSFGDSTAFAV